ncbi:epoxyqueuosine reductase [Thermogemmatispora tikiterensis]|uniref:Epoxyqueuosine reductase n=2 Tax=Thermogemmatispora tikiterensis TaxID=1825093 RepID=A0A328VBJ5_9CHLR|nr:epoxyqueuosine reductase [Thermogemmatispora tikiterensis]
MAAEARGFLVAWAPIELPGEWKQSYQQWVAEGRHAGLGQLARALEVRLDPRLRFAWASSVMILAAPHTYPDPGPPSGGVRIGQVARKFWVREPDPFLLKRLLEPHIAALKEVASRLGVRVRDYVEQGPLPLNLYAVLSGRFWRGYNAMPNSTDFGTRVTLTCLLTDIALDRFPPPSHPDRCGECRRCLSSCPTGALLGDRRVDLRLCISYWTTSYQGVIPLAFRPAIGNWLLGCDVCQDVCPWNWKTERLPQWWKGFSVDPELAHPDLCDALLLSTRDFALKYRQSAFERLGRVQIARNALIVLANTGEQVYAPLVKQAAADPAPVIRATASWALLRLGQRGEAEKLLRDPSDLVRAETREALEHFQ